MKARLSFSGVTRKFSGQGRKLGYPTANIEAPADAKDGLYLGYTELNNKLLPSIIFIGKPITLEETNRRAESYIIDFEDRDLYGEEIIMLVVKKLRNNKKFNSVEELKDQMKKDEQAAKEYFQQVSSKR